MVNFFASQSVSGRQIFISYYIPPGFTAERLKQANNIVFQPGDHQEVLKVNPMSLKYLQYFIYIVHIVIIVDHTSHRHLGVPGIVGICVAVGIVLVAAAIVVIMTYTKKGIRVPRGGGAVTYNQIYDDSTLAMDPIETEMVSNPMSNT